jgi:hypothetical protein
MGTRTARAWSINAKRIKLWRCSGCGHDYAARIILADPGKYAGLPLEWARIFIDRHNHEKSKSMRAPFGTPRKPEKQTKRLAAAS